MAKYKADPYYVVDAGKVRVCFNFFGDYETDDEAEIAALDALIPTWIKREDDEDSTEDKPATKAPAPRKATSAK